MRVLHISILLDIQMDKTYHENEYLDETIVSAKEGKTFEGWYTEYLLYNEVDYTKSLGNTTLYAKWQEEILPIDLNYTVTITIS